MEIGKLNGAFVFCLTVSAILAAVYYWHIDMPRTAQRQLEYKAYIENIPPDWQREGMKINYINKVNYRVLAPFLLYWPINFVAQFTTYQRSFLLLWLIFDFAAIFFSVYALFYYLKNWFTEREALFVVLLSALVWVFTFKDQSFAPWSLLELGFLSLGLNIIYKKRKFRWLIILLIIATLNRNTSALLIPAFLFANWRTDKNVFAKTLSLLFTWFATIFIIGLFRQWQLNFGIQDLIIALKYQWYSNTHYSEYFFGALINIGLFVAPFFVVSFATLTIQKNVPIFLKKMLWVAPLYLLSYFILGGWTEVRLLVALFPFVLPIAFWGYFEKDNFSFPAKS